MYYQLPSGKTIKISIEDYLNMTDEMEQILISQNVGDSLSLWHDSAIKPHKNTKFKDDDDDEEIIDLDYDIENEELKSEQDIDINNIPDEDSFDTAF